MDNNTIRELNHKSTYIYTDYWEGLLGIINDNLDLLEDDDCSEFVAVTWSKLTNKFELIYNDQSGQIALLDDYRDHYENNPNDYDEETWDEVLETLDNDWDIRFLNEDSKDPKEMFFYDIFNILGMEDFAEQMDEY